MNNIDLSGVESSLDAIANSQGIINSVSSVPIAVFTSIATFVFCELLKNILFEPRSRYKKIKEEVAGFIRYYSPYYSNPIKITDENVHSKQVQEYITAKDDLRRCASQLMGFADVLPVFHFFIPGQKKLYEASNRLFVLSSKCIDSVWERIENSDTAYRDESIDSLVWNIKNSLKIKSRSIEEKQ